jgi:hypothetical protein
MVSYPGADAVYLISVAAVIVHDEVSSFIVAAAIPPRLSRRSPGFFLNPAARSQYASWTAPGPNGKER